METIQTFSTRFLTGGGEMGKLTREYNWAETPVGPVESWPQSLCTTLSILLNAKFPMFLWWGEELTCFYNDAYRPSLGNEGKHPSALGKPGAEVWPEIWPVIKPLIDQVLNGGEATWSEDQLIPIYRNGKLEDVYWTFSYGPVKDEEGEIGGVLVICNETTRQVSDATRYKLYDERFQNLVREATVGIVVLIGEEMRVDIANEMYALLLNRTEDELLGKPLFDIIPEAADPFYPMLLKVLKTGEPLFLYDRPYFLLVNGEKKEGFLNVVYQPFKENNGNIIGVMALCHDVTEQVLTRHKIEQAEEKARLAIDSADLGTYEINLQTDDMITSARFNEIWGVDEPIPRSQFASYIHPDDRSTRINAHEESIKTGNLHYEARIVHKDNSIHWVRVEGKVLYDRDGKPASLLGVIQDITEQKHFAQQLSDLVRERTLELQRSNEDLLQFAHVTSHDLKEPVRKIRIFSDRIKNELGDVLPETGKLYLEKVQHATDRMFSMIEGVLLYSALSSSEQVIETIDLNKLIKSVEIDLEVLIQQKRARVIANHLPEIEGASVLMYQLFYNLVNNALKFSKVDEECVIHISSSREMNQEKEFVNISVSDNGIGFGQEYAEKIFNAFTRLHPKDEFEGTGLGLALCKKIANRHGGDIMATGKNDRGAIFTVALPLKQKRERI